MNLLSACLITLDEENNLPRALTSLAGIARRNCGSGLRKPGPYNGDCAGVRREGNHQSMDEFCRAEKMPPWRLPATIGFYRWTLTNS